MLKIKYKILLLVGIFLVIRFPFDMYISNYFINLGKETENSVISTYENVQVLLEMKNIATKIQLLTSNLANKINSAPDKDISYEDDKNELLSTMAEFEKWQDQYHNLEPTDSKSILNSDNIEKIKNNIIIHSLNIFEKNINVKRRDENRQELADLSRYVASLSKYIEKAISSGINKLNLKKEQSELRREYLKKTVFIIDIILLMIGLIFSFFIAQHISGPIMRLTKHATNMTAQFSPTKTQHFSGDEVALLTSSINKFVAEITRDNKNLDHTNKNLRREIEARKASELKNAALSKELITASRQAGMADIATSMLHNIGNVLNSVNVSTILIKEIIIKSEISTLNKVVNLLQAHQQNMETFIAQDPQGKLIPNYLLELSQIWEADKDKLLKETEILDKNVERIQSIITSQKELKQVVGVNEEVIISELLEEALTLNHFLYEKTNIEIIRDFDSIQPAVLDRLKLMQVLLNLIKNAIESIIENNAEKKQLILRIKEKDNKSFIIQIEDSGLGILPEDITKIFSPDFKKGAGFGLHASALAMIEMKGLCSVESKGIGKGAIFTLKLPYSL